MENWYNKSIQMIKRLDIKTEEEYNKLHKYFLVLNSESIKYISQERDFEKIVKG